MNHSLDGQFNVDYRPTISTGTFWATRAPFGDVA